MFEPTHVQPFDDFKIMECSTITSATADPDFGQLGHGQRTALGALLHSFS